jgi:hypothetical protein
MPLFRMNGVNATGRFQIEAARGVSAGFSTVLLQDFFPGTTLASFTCCVSTWKRL